MDSHDHPSSDSDRDAYANHDHPPKRARRSLPQPPSSTHASSSHQHEFDDDDEQGQDAMNGNGHDVHSIATPDADSKPLLLPSILGVEPLDEFIREIADFVHYHISHRPQDAGGTVEVEAKIGVMKDRASGQRLQLPVLVETILAPGSTETRFESNMSPRQHQHFNKLLNKLKIEQPALDISYEHLHLVDNFFASDDSRGEKIRVTRDEKTGQVRACMRKVRLGDLNVYCPKRAVDWRISVNMEIPVNPPLGSPTHTRRKDRMSYTHQEFIIDLTQVTATSSPNSKPDILHELEVELKDSNYLLSIAAKRGDPSLSKEEAGAFDDLVHAFVNNARILTRNANPSANPNDGR